MEWLTPANAAKKFNISESAVKRLIYKLQKEKPTFVKKEGRLNFINILAFDINNSEKTVNERTEANERANERTEANERTDGERTNKENINIHIYNNFIDTLQKELNEKNEQIRLLQVDADQKNKIIAHLQTRLQISPPANERTNGSERTNAAILGLLLAIFILIILVFVSL